MRLVLPFLAALSLAACASRPLTLDEAAFAATVQGPQFDVSKVRIVKGSVTGLVSRTVPPRPQDSCAARLFPPQTGPQQVIFPAMTLDETVYYVPGFYRRDQLAGYPRRMALTDAMRLAHELTHVWQWQHRRETGYHPVRAMTEHARYIDPYRAAVDPDVSFSDYGFEQQGGLVAEFVCCRALDPDSARTEALYQILREPFPAIARREVAESALLPMPLKSLKGMCD